MKEIPTQSARLTSIDVFRGLTVAAMLLVNNAGDWSHVYPWLEHAEWNGCTLADFIFPFFLFIVGVSLELALVPKLETQSQSDIWRGVAWRASKIFLLGVALHVVAMMLIPDRSFRLMGVLQRIGICFFLAATALIFLRHTFALCLVSALTLIVYWALLHFNGGYYPDTNVVDRVDTSLLGPLSYQFDAVTFRAHEPEGILSSLPATVNVLLGLLAARLLRHGRHASLFLMAVCLLVLAWVWSWWMPLNKQLWTSSFVCWTCGWATLLMICFHYLIDLKRLPALGLSFGVNAIVAYAGAWLATCLIAATNAMYYLYPKWLVSSLSQAVSEAFASFVFALAFTLCFGGVMYLMRRRGWRISI